MANRKISYKGLNFTKAEENFVSKAYRDAVGRLSLGYGFTNLSGTVQKYYGRITPDSTITKSEATKILKACMDEEYGVYANRYMKNPEQHHFDMACSGCYNLGPKMFKWQWCEEFNNGDIEKAAALWRNSGVIKGGRKLLGLVRRRDREANLLLYKDYGNINSGPTVFKKEPLPIVADPELIQYQKKLKYVGYNPGPNDGWMGDSTELAVKHFQKDDKHLKVDGKLGRATKETIDRKVSDKKSVRSLTLASATGTGMSFLGWLGDQSELITYFVLGTVGLMGAYIVIKYRVRLENKLKELIE